MSEPTVCTNCRKSIRPGREVWLELDFRTGRYHKNGVSPAVSQGWFPFGADCAKTVAALDNASAL